MFWVHFFQIVSARCRTSLAAHKISSTTPPSASPTDPPTASEGTAAPSEKVDPVPATPAPTTTTDPVPQTTAPTTKPDPVPATPAPSGKTDPAPAPTLSPVAPEPTIAPAGSPVAPASTDPPTTSVPGDGSCAPNPCQNGGSCAEDTGGGFICSCTSGFAGMKCQTSTEGTVWCLDDAYRPKSYDRWVPFLACWSPQNKKAKKLD